MQGLRARQDAASGGGGSGPLPGGAGGMSRHPKGKEARHPIDHDVLVGNLPGRGLTVCS